MFWQRKWRPPNEKTEGISENKKNRDPNEKHVCPNEAGGTMIIRLRGIKRRDFTPFTQIAKFIFGHHQCLSIKRQHINKNVT